MSSRAGGRSPIGTVRALLRVSSPSPGRFLLGTGLGIGAAACTVALMACSGALIDKAALRPPLYTLTVLMAAVQILALGRGPLRYAERLVSHDAALRVLGRLRLWLYDEIEPRSPAGLRRWHSGDLLARATADVDSLQGLFVRSVSPVVVAVVTSLFAVTAVSVILPSAGLVLAGCVAGAIGLGSIMAWVRQRRSGAEESRLRGELAAAVVELLHGAPDLLAFGADELYLDRALHADEALTRLARRRSWTAGAISATTIAFTGAAVVGSLVLAIPAIGSHHLPAFMLAVLPLVALGTFEVVSPVADAVSALPGHLAAADGLLAVADLPIPVVDPVDPAPVPAETDIALSEAGLRYGADQPWALDGLTMSVPAGRRVAVVGPSGAGKSSVVNVLLRFWELAGGTANLGGTSMDRLAQDTVRSEIGWVAQDTHLFNTTIRANIALARPQATEDEIAAAARAAQLGPWIDSLPEGLDTEVGEQGAMLSGGQRQRVALARALLARPPVLVLDEPTSGLDEQTAARLLDDVLLSTADQSLVYVTHRLDELSGFDEVKVIEHGRVVGTCPPADDRQPVIATPASASDHALDSGEAAFSSGRVGA